MSHPLARAVCADERVLGVLHRLCDGLCPLLEARQFRILEQPHASRESVPFGHRLELRRMLADAFQFSEGGPRRLQLRVSLNFFSGGNLAGRTTLNVELRDAAFLRGRTGSSAGSVAFITVLGLPVIDGVDDNSTDVEPYVQRLFVACEQLDGAWLARTAQSACERLCAAMAP